jgi:hypothetical protein
MQKRKESQTFSDILNLSLRDIVFLFLQCIPQFPKKYLKVGTKKNSSFELNSVVHTNGDARTMCKYVLKIF